MAKPSLETIQVKADLITYLLRKVGAIGADERAELQVGNATQAWRLYFSSPDSGQYTAPLRLNDDNFLGNTKKEAYTTISAIESTIWAVHHAYERQKDKAEYLAKVEATPTVHTVDKEVSN
jgi:hypothetical protein